MELGHSTADLPAIPPGAWTSIPTTTVISPPPVTPSCGRLLRGRGPSWSTDRAGRSVAFFYRRLRQSAFYATSLDSLLNRVETNRITLTGQVTGQCILYTALDAYVRHFDLVIARDAVAYIDDRLGSAALRMIERNMGGTLLSARNAWPTVTRDVDGHCAPRTCRRCLGFGGGRPGFRIGSSRR